MSKTYTVVLDPGHGATTNPYPAAKGFYEGTQMFKLMTMLKPKLEKYGIKVLTTRHVVTDDPTLVNRGKLAGTNKADLFISLHSDAVGNGGIQTPTGVSVFYSITDSETNKKFASSLASAVSTLMQTKNRGAQTRIGNGGTDYYGVIRNSAASGCKHAFLIEHGFHTSVSDVQWLINDTNLNKITDVETEVICNYFNIKYNGSDTVTVPDSDTSANDSEKITIYKPLDKYVNAANAMSGDTSLSVGKLAVGTYYIYKIYGTATNLTKTPGVAGSWVVIGDAASPATTVNPDVTETVPEVIDLPYPVKIYENAVDAMNMTNAIKNDNKYSYYPSGKYYIYKKYTNSDSVMNISTKEGIPGAWINQNGGKYDITPDFTVGDIVVFESGTPKYSDGNTIPTLVLAQICSQKSGVVLDIDSNNNVTINGLTKTVPSCHLKLYAKATDKTKQIVEQYNNTKQLEKVTKEDIISVLETRFGNIESLASSNGYKEFIKYMEDIMGDDTEIDQDTGYESIMGKSVLTADQLYNYIKKNNPDFNYVIAYAFIKLGNIYGIRGDIACCQSIVETGWFKFIGSSVSPSQNNFCGLGATGNGAPGCKFETVEIGVEAQLQHLYAYACTQDVPSGRTMYDPRFKYVTRGIAPRWVDLNNRWCTGPDYGEKILSIYKQISMSV